MIRNLKGGVVRRFTFRSTRKGALNQHVVDVLASWRGVSAHIERGSLKVETNTTRAAERVTAAVTRWGFKQARNRPAPSGQLPPLTKSEHQWYMALCKAIHENLDNGKVQFAIALANELVSQHRRLTAKEFAAREKVTTRMLPILLHRPVLRKGEIEDLLNILELAPDHPQASDALDALIAATKAVAKIESWGSGHRWQPNHKIARDLAARFAHRLDALTAFESLLRLGADAATQRKYLTEIE